MPRRKKWLQDLPIHLFLIAASAFALFPIIWGLSTSFKTQYTALSLPPTLLPNPFTWANYADVLLGSNLPRYFLNSGVVSVLTILFTLFLGAHGGYAASRYNFRGKNALLFLILMTVMIPGIATLLPVYSLVVKLGLHDTKLALVLVYTASQLPTVLWLMQGFFDQIPKELDEAAKIDGCTPLQLFYRIVLPLSRPGMIAASIIVYIFVWNEFIISLTLTAKDPSRTIQVGLYNYIGALGIEWGQLMAVSMLSLLPVLVLFGAQQRRLIQGLTSGSTKG